MSMATGGSSSSSSSLIAESVFNMADEHDVLALLRQIHLSVLPLEIKNYLRDLVFSTRFGTPLPVDTAMIATFKTHGFVITTSAAAKAELMAARTPQPTSAVPRKPVALVIGFARHAPQFASAAGAITSAPAPMTPIAPESQSRMASTDSYVVDTDIPEILLETPVVATATQAEPSAPSSATSTVTPISLTPAADAASSSVVLDTPIALDPVPEVAPTVSSSAVATEPVLVPPPIPATQTPLAPQGQEPGERIAAIKREVNSLVGNPVNLIDVNNDVGREYMNALLDAMKKTLGATSTQETERAMARLERAFVAVKETLGQSADTGTPSPVMDAAPTTAEPAVAPAAHISVPTVSEPVVTSGAAEAPLPVSEPVVPAMASVVPEIPGVAEPVQRRILSVASLDEAPAPGVTPFKSVAQTVVETSGAGVAETSGAGRVSAMPAAPASMPSREPLPASDDANSSDVQSAVPEAVFGLAQAEELPKQEVITSVAKEKQLKELMEARQAAEAASAAMRANQASHNPLMADDVTSGLGQLLSEWKLFKSSGIFGTGPSGIEHPLYKKISQLTMAAVLAGRFEGATPEIKRSISDYMNGWRYEEGIIHEQGETFEYYLRRVIRHILDNQGKQ